MVRQSINTQIVRRVAQFWLLLLVVVAANMFAASAPILLIGGSGDKFSFYNSEILKAEGFNAFDTVDISTVNAKTLNRYDVVILGHVALSRRESSLFNSWVNGGGNLIALRPDRQLARLFGIRSAGSTLSNAYLRIDTSSMPGTGIVGQPMQFHGTADLYLPDGASVVAALCSTAQTMTPYPAVTVRRNIGRGGSAAAFTYDLARSVVYTRQGNPSWAGQARVRRGGPIRSVDLFFGNAKADPQRDWVDLNNIAIPQADEQQRLLANLILHLNVNRKPLPRFWYFPFAKKAVMVMTGDDHGGGATAARFDDFIASSPQGCVVANWECVRGTSYLLTRAPITNAQAEKYTRQGFEVAVHLSSRCADWAPESLDSAATTQFSAFATKLPSIPSPVTNRTHCIAWSDWASEAQIELKHGVRLDTSYYYWPRSWVARTPGLFTGSGMPMRFAQTDGTIIDVYQVATQVPDESGEVLPDFMDRLFENAIGPRGFYGVFTANMHTDFNGGRFPKMHQLLRQCSGDACSSQLWADQLVSSAQKRGVPVVSARQMLTWLDGRNGSAFESITWSGRMLTFKVTAARGAVGLHALLPEKFGDSRLASLAQDGKPVSYVVETIKGVSYAVFPAKSGLYTASYRSRDMPGKN